MNEDQREAVAAEVPTWVPMRAETVTYLRTLHPDPFTQAAVFRLWKNARGLLREDIAWAITRTQDPNANHDQSGE